MKIQFELDSFYTAQDLVSKLLDGDGAGSGLDADLLDGQHGAYYLPASTYTAADILSKLLTVDGAGSGLDADKLDGTELAKILALGSTIPGSANLNNYTTTGLFHQPLTVNAGTGSNYPVALAGMLEVIADGSLIYQKYTVYDSVHNVYVRTCENGTWYSWTRILDSADLSTINTNLATKLNISTYTAADILSKLLTVDGAGSGLDADLLDGQHSAYYLPASTYTAADILTKLKTVDGVSSGLDADLLDGQHSAYYLAAENYNANDILSKLLTVDGTGTNLDADKLDGQHASAFAATGHNHDSTYVPLAGGGRLVRIDSKNVSGVSSIVFSGLNGDNDETYFIRGKIKYDTPGAASLALTPNNVGSLNCTLAQTGLTSGGASLAAYTNNAGALSVFVAAGGFGICEVDFTGFIEASRSFIRKSSIEAHPSFGQSGEAGNGAAKVNSSWKDTSTNITSLSIMRDDNSNISGKVVLYKVVDS